MKDNFWHPIQSCPKDSNVLYLLANKGKSKGKRKIRVGKWREDLRAWGNTSGHCNSKSDPDYYAEIPPLLEEQAQDRETP